VGLFLSLLFVKRRRQNGCARQIGRNMVESVCDVFLREKLGKFQFNMILILTLVSSMLQYRKSYS